MRALPKTKEAIIRLRKAISDVQDIRRKQRALRLIEKSQRIDPTVLGEIIIKTMEIAAERIQNGEPDRDGTLRVNLTDVISGPWGDRV